MDAGEIFTRWTIRIAMGCSFLAAASRLAAGEHRPWQSCARMLWTAGCAAYLGHVYCAFEFYHHWSHAAAYHSTARETALMVGIHWGGGIYFNYAFTLAWIADVARQWLAPRHELPGPALVTAAWHAFFAFMVFQATVVFAAGMVRWLGLAGCSALGLLWWAGKRRRRPSPTNWNCT